MKTIPFPLKTMQKTIIKTLEEVPWQLGLKKWQAFSENLKILKNKINLRVYVWSTKHMAPKMVTKCNYVLQKICINFYKPHV